MSPDLEAGAARAIADALARLYDLDLSEDPGDDIELSLALAERTGGPILELGAGSGRIARPLAEAGHAVTAVDIDPAMLARLAIGRLLGITSIEADLTTWRSPTVSTCRWLCGAGSRFWRSPNISPAPG